MFLLKLLFAVLEAVANHLQKNIERLEKLKPSEQKIEDKL